MHTRVPGPDGKLGFGGKCFPKDLLALLHVAELLNVPARVLLGAWQTNFDVREDHDWLRIEGAVVK